MKKKNLYFQSVKVGPFFLLLKGNFSNTSFSRSNISQSKLSKLVHKNKFFPNYGILTALVYTQTVLVWTQTAPGYYFAPSLLELVDRITFLLYSASCLAQIDHPTTVSLPQSCPLWRFDAFFIALMANGASLGCKIMSKFSLSSFQGSYFS